MDEVAFLKGLVAIPSPSGEEDAVAEFLVKRMTALGFRARRDEVGNVIGELGNQQAEREIVLLGHMDTVPGLIPVRQEDDRLYGRGAVDAKGPLATFVLAAARAAPLSNDVRLVVIGAIEEETHSRGAHHLARARPSPNCVIIGEPSGWQGITLGYKGALNLNYRLVRPAGHSAGGQPAPAEEAVAFWSWLRSYAQVLNRGSTHRFNTLDPTLRVIRTFGDGLKAGVKMDVELRLPPGIDVAALQQRIRAWNDGGAEVAFPYSEPPFRAEKNTAPVRALLRAIRAVGGQPRFKLKTGTSDMNVVSPAWGCPSVAYGPGDSSFDHTPDEHISIKEYHQAIRVMTQALTAL